MTVQYGRMLNVKSERTASKDSNWTLKGTTSGVEEVAIIIDNLIHKDMGGNSS